MTSPGAVVALLSGGVDSAVAAALLQRQGWRVTGLHLLLAPGDEGSPECARAVARHLGIHLREEDLREEFRRLVTEPFVAEYAGGRTPNPCVVCNPEVKFAAALRLADRLGGAAVATGHYARVGRDEAGRPRLRKGADVTRDQSYFLHRLGTGALSRVVFPLGDLTKGEVRKAAVGLELPVATREDSQEVCFIPDGHTQGFVARHLGESGLRPGTVVDRSGRLLGRHAGIHGFTLGQRRGLGVAAGRPLYVAAIDASTGTVTVGEEADLLSAHARVVDLAWSAPPPEGPFRALVRIRQRHREAPATLTVEGEAMDVTFDSPQRAVTPGQSAVVYDGDLVLGGGVIESGSGAASPGEGLHE